MKKIIAIQVFENQTQHLEIFKESVRTLSDKGFALHCVTTSRQAKKLSHISNVSTTIIDHSDSGQLITRFYRFLKLQLTLFVIALRALKKGDILYLYSIYAITPALIARLKGIRIVYKVSHNQIQSGIFYRFLKWIVDRTADQLIFTSAASKKQFGIKSSKQAVIYDILPKQSFKKAFKATQFTDHTLHTPFHVLTIGHSDEPSALAQFCELAGMLPQFKFTLLLNEEWMASDLSFKNALNLSSNIQINFKEESRHELFCEADAFVDLSSGKKHLETAQLNVLDAMHYGIPVIVPQADGIKELIVIGEHGLAIDQSNLKEIAQSLQVLATEIPLYHTISKSCQSRSMLFTHELYGRQLVNIFQALRQDPFDNLFERFGISCLTVTSL